MFLLRHHRHHRSDQQFIMSKYTVLRMYAMTCVVNELAQRPKFRGADTVTLGMGFDPATTQSSLQRQSRALTTELQRATCGKLTCRERLGSFLSNPLICFECSYSNIERINEGIISNAKHEQQRRIPETPLSLSQ